MKYEHQINWANAYDNNLDDCSKQLLQNVFIYLLSTVELLLSLGMDKNPTLYIISLKNRTNLYDFLQITRVYALFLSVSFKSTFADFDLVINMLALSAVCHRVCVCCVFVLFSRLKKFRF